MISPPFFEHCLFTVHFKSALFFPPLKGEIGAVKVLSDPHQNSTIYEGPSGYKAMICCMAATVNTEPLTNHSYSGL